MRTPRRALLLLGSNLERERNLPLALRSVGRRFEVEARSAVCESEPVDAPGTPRFHNQAILIRCELRPDELQSWIRGVEARLGRRRGADPNAPRTIDIDVLLWIDDDDRVLAEPPPDPDLARHHHVAIPAAEIAGRARLPGTPPRTIADLSRALGPPPSGFRRIDQAPLDGLEP